MPMHPSALILHVDDERAVRDAVSLLLRAEGYAVHSAADGAQALQAAADGLRPDVLIVDFNLGRELNGRQVAEQIGALLGYTPPVIVLTGALSTVALPRITEVPVWLAHKPLDPSLLLAALPGLVALSRATRRLTAPAAATR